MPFRVLLPLNSPRKERRYIDSIIRERRLATHRANKKKRFLAPFRKIIEVIRTELIPWLEQRTENPR